MLMSSARLVLALPTMFRGPHTLNLRSVVSLGKGISRGDGSPNRSPESAEKVGGAPEGYAHNNRLQSQGYELFQIHPNMPQHNATTVRDLGDSYIYNVLS